ncbi:rano class II histocompatibility antigen, A beta chain-like [Chaetodon trifascialis]|uniref:rano class II histocompatibility antigen, A beta chain-like n=1 Tax=Chaetodon trifascialis TaxID=109706 RepID=UPI003996730D
MGVCSFFPLLCLLLFFSRAGALFGYGLLRCQLISSDNIVYLEQVYFNKVLLVQYNSTLGQYTGYTRQTKEIADDLNKNHAFLTQERKNEEKCKTILPWMFDDFSKPVEPSVTVRSVEAVGSKHQSMLVCTVYNFYPKQIRVTWLRNGEEVTSDVTSTDELSSGNWLYQIHSYLEFTPRPGEKISCMVEHASLMQPKIYEWDPAPGSEINKIAVGTAGLLLGLVFFGTGVTYYKKNTTGQVLVPTS